jgi:hypothetical protein
MIVESHNCQWLLGQQHDSLGGGSVYVFRLPDPIPAAGTPGGPPLLADRYEWPTQRSGPDVRAILLGIVRAPETIPEVTARIVAEYKKAQAAAKQRK